MKYYYQAQKDYERDNPGKKAYEQVSGSLTFAQYFKNQSEEFKRSWLGAKRYQLYVDGALNENKIFAPDLGYTVSTPVLFKVSKSESVAEEDLENLIREPKERFKENEFGLKIFGYLSNVLSNFNRSALSDSLEDNIKEYSKQELNDRQREANRLEESKKQFFKPKDFTSPTTIQEATTYAQKMFNVEVDYSKARSLEVVNELNESLRSFFETYGDLGTLAKIELADYLGLDIAQYSPDSMTLRVLNTSRDRIEKIIEKQNQKGHWNSKSIKDIIAHEGGHMIGEYLKQIDFDNHFIRMGCAVKMGERLENNGVLKLSEYSKYSPNEFLAEVVSAISANHFRKQYLNIFRIYFTDNVKEYYKGWIEVHGNS